MSNVGVPWWAWSGGLPPKPTREQLATGQLTFQGFSCQTEEFGEILIQCLDTVVNDGDRQRQFAEMHRIGDTHAMFIVSHAYLEPGIDPPLSTERDWTNDYPGLRALLLQAIKAGFLIDLRLAGDGQSVKENGVYVHNDPVGWTYGADWLLENFVHIVDGIGRDLAPYIRWCLGFDGVWYGWRPDQIKAFGTLFRQTLLNGVLAWEPAAPPHLGNGRSDWEQGGGLYEYDVTLLEVGIDPNDGHNDSLYQPGARLLGPSYVRPPDQPPLDDPGAPFGPNAPQYYYASTRNGLPRFAIAFEDYTYLWTRRRCTLQTVQDFRSYKRSVGFTAVG